MPLWDWHSCLLCVVYDLYKIRLKLPVPGLYSLCVSPPLVFSDADSCAIFDNSFYGLIKLKGDTAAGAPLPFMPGDAALCGSRPLVTPY